MPLTYKILLSKKNLIIIKIVESSKRQQLSLLLDDNTNLSYSTFKILDDFVDRITLGYIFLCSLITGREFSSYMRFITCSKGLGEFCIVFLIFLI